MVGNFWSSRHEDTAKHEGKRTFCLFLFLPSDMWRGFGRARLRCCHACRAQPRVWSTSSRGVNRVGGLVGGWVGGGGGGCLGGEGGQDRARRDRKGNRKLTPFLGQGTSVHQGCLVLRPVHRPWLPYEQPACVPPAALFCWPLASAADPSQPASPVCHHPVISAKVMALEKQLLGEWYTEKTITQGRQRSTSCKGGSTSWARSCFLKRFKI